MLAADMPAGEASPRRTGSSALTTGRTRAASTLASGEGAGVGAVRGARRRDEAVKTRGEAEAAVQVEAEPASTSLTGLSEAQPVRGPIARTAVRAAERAVQKRNESIEERTGVAVGRLGWPKLARFGLNGATQMGRTR